MQTPSVKLHLVPLQVADLGSPKTVPVGDQDHGGVAMPVPARLAGRGHQVFDLLGREMFPGAGN
jgi:hypothetical protein